MSYKILGKELELRVVCAKNLKVCKELGLLNTGNAFSQEELDLIRDALENGGEAQTWKAIEIVKRNPKINEMEIYLNPEKLIRLVDAVFQIAPEDLKEFQEKWEEIETEQVINGAFEFLGKCQPSSPRFLQALSDIVSLSQQAVTASSKT